MIIKVNFEYLMDVTLGNLRLMGFRDLLALAYTTQPSVKTSIFKQSTKQTLSNLQTYKAINSLMS